MTLTLFEGPAGSGKTTQLFEATAAHLASSPLDHDQQVLALTKMHGSRRRMLTGVLNHVGTTHCAECLTLNGFILGLIHRWQALGATLVDTLPLDTDFPGVSDLAAELLTRPPVRSWVATRYPLLVIDELQDLRGSDLAVVQELEKGLHILGAADEFQDLNPHAASEALAWARANGTVVPLNTIHRTNVPTLLSAARTVRAGTPPAQGPGFRVFRAPSAAVAASFLARNLTYAGSDPVAVLSPVRPDKSSFVRNALSRLREKPFTKGSNSFGPFRVPWEASSDSEIGQLEKLLALDQHDRVVTTEEILEHETALPPPFLDWHRTRHRLTGQTEFSGSVVRAQIERSLAVVRAHVPPRILPRVGLTIHQAKNREFDRVILLWPVQIPQDQDVQRRLLYNAITRAKRGCITVVQDPNPKSSRLSAPPFA